jgi:hypothetical protein
MARLGEDADDAGPAGLVVAGQRRRVVDRRHRALGRAGTLDLGDHGHVLATERGDSITGRSLLGHLLEPLQRRVPLAGGQIGAHAFQDLVEHAHAVSYPLGSDALLRVMVARPVPCSGTHPPRRSASGVFAERLACGISKAHLTSLMAGQSPGTAE